MPKFLLGPPSQVARRPTARSGMVPANYVAAEGN